MIFSEHSPQNLPEVDPVNFTKRSVADLLSKWINEHEDIFPKNTLASKEAHRFSFPENEDKLAIKRFNEVADITKTYLNLIKTSDDFNPEDDALFRRLDPIITSTYSALLDNAFISYQSERKPDLEEYADFCTQVNSVYIGYAAQLGNIEDIEKLLEHTKLEFADLRGDYYQTLLSNAVVELFRAENVDNGLRLLQNLADRNTAFRELIQVAEAKKEIQVLLTLVGFADQELSQDTLIEDCDLPTLKDQSLAALSRIYNLRGHYTEMIEYFEQIHSVQIQMETALGIMQDPQTVILDPVDYDMLFSYFIRYFENRWDHEEDSLYGRLWNEKQVKSLSDYEFISFYIKMLRLIPDTPTSLDSYIWHDPNTGNVERDIYEKDIYERLMDQDPHSPEAIFYNYNNSIYSSDSGEIDDEYSDSDSLFSTEASDQIARKSLSPDEAIKAWSALLQMVAEKHDFDRFRKYITLLKSDDLASLTKLTPTDPYYYEVKKANAIENPDIFDDLDFSEEHIYESVLEWRLSATYICLEDRGMFADCLEQINAMKVGILGNVELGSISASVLEELRTFFNDMAILSIREGDMEMLAEIMKQPVMDLEQVAHFMNQLSEYFQFHKPLLLSVEIE